MCEKTKKCTKCKEVKGLEEFTIDNKRSDSKSVYCKECSKTIYYEKSGKEPPIQLIPKNGYKFCSCCKEEKEQSCFNKSSDTQIGLASKCKECRKTYRLEFKQRAKIDIESKECSSCKILKPKEDFHRHSHTIDGYNASCIVCVKECIENRKIRTILTEKTCTKCGELKTVSKFYKDVTKKDDLSSSCKVCIDLRIEENSEAITTKRKAHFSKNREAVNYRRRKRNKERRETDPFYKLSQYTRVLIKDTFKRACQGKYSKSKRTEEILGCTVPEFINHLVSQFTEGMTLENHGNCAECWSIDHIIPVSVAWNEHEIIELNHWTNLQPMWHIENIKKGKKIIPKRET